MSAATHNAYELSNLAGCATPDALDSDGAKFLVRVEDAVREWCDENRDERAAVAANMSDDAHDAVHEIADNAANLIYTVTIWRTFTDLAAWEAFDEYAEEMGSSEVSNDYGAGMLAQAVVGLYWIAQRLAGALIERWADEDEDED